ncbi:MAG: YegP family protein [Thiobacillus sp.]|nr:YegP family protein [Thiobacillus sp.]
MDRASKLDPLSEPINKISYQTVEAWTLTVKQFVDRLFSLVPNELKGTRRPHKRPAIDSAPNKSALKSADERRTARDTSISGTPVTTNKVSQLKKTNGWFELSSNDKRLFSFVLKAGNGEVLLRSEHYATQASAENGIKSVQINSLQDARYERKDSSDGRCYFNLKAANHQVIGTSQMYKAAAGREAGIEAVKTNGTSTTVKTV